MPPQSNGIYPTNRVTGRRQKSAGLIKYEKEVEWWRLEHLSVWRELKNYLSKGQSEFDMFLIDSVFLFPRKQILTLDGRMKSMDASNRIKVLHDTLVDLTGVDDRYFQCGLAEKAWIGDDEGACAAIRIRKTRLRNGKEALNLLKGVSSSSLENPDKG